MISYVQGKGLVFPPEFAEVEGWFEEWLMDIRPTSRRTTPARKWGAFVFWCGAWKKLPLDIEKAKSKRGI